MSEEFAEVCQELGFLLRLMRGKKFVEEKSRVRQPVRFHVALREECRRGRRRGKRGRCRQDAEPLGKERSHADAKPTILLLVPNEHFDEISYRVEGYGILTITKPFEPFYFYNMMKIAIAVQYRVQILSSQTIKLKVKMEEIKQVNRAKMLLMQQLKMTEAEAHRYLEKEAMDRGLKRIALAEEIIRMYG